MLTTFDPKIPGAYDGSDTHPGIKLLIEAANSQRDLTAVMQDMVRSCGFDSFLFAISTGPKPNHDSRSYVWTSLPREWVAIYDQRSYIEVDPRIQDSWNRSSPMIWDAALIRGSPATMSFLAHAAEFGIRSGLVLPFASPTHARYGLLLNSSESPVNARRRGEIDNMSGSWMVFTTQFHDFFTDHVLGRGTNPQHQGAPLSAREIECLQFAACGMTSADIGIKLGIAERTVNWHFSNLISKLGVLNRHEAIAHGVAIGLIRPWR